MKIDVSAPNTMQKGFLITDRLILRKLRIDDADEMFSTWCNDPEVTKYMTWNPHENIEVTKLVLSSWLKQYDEPSTVRYGITLKSSGKLIGSIDVVGYFENAPEIGYCIGKAYWNNGYMTEACKALIDYLISLGHKRIIIRAAKDNIGSNRVIQKCGLTLFMQTEEPASIIKPELITINWYELKI